MAVAIATLALHSLKNVSSGGDLLALQSAMDCCALVREGGREGVRGGGTPILYTSHTANQHPTPHSTTSCRALMSLSTLTRHTFTLSHRLSRHLRYARPSVRVGHVRLWSACVTLSKEVRGAVWAPTTSVPVLPYTIPQPMKVVISSGRSKGRRKKVDHTHLF